MNTYKETIIKKRNPYSNKRITKLAIAWIHIMQAKNMENYFSHLFFLPSEKVK
jgi:hypothetical protein